VEVAERGDVSGPGTEQSRAPYPATPQTNPPSASLIPKLDRRGGRRRWRERTTRAAEGRHSSPWCTPPLVTDPPTRTSRSVPRGGCIAGNFVGLATQKCPLSMALVDEVHVAHEARRSSPGRRKPSPYRRRAADIWVQTPLLLESYVPRAYTSSAAVRGLQYASTVLLCPILRPKVFLKVRPKVIPVLRPVLRPILWLVAKPGQPRPMLPLPRRIEPGVRLMLANVMISDAELTR
jgi:hypothetical protein